jgi:hypothetical protein
MRVAQLLQRSIVKSPEAAESSMTSLLGVETDMLTNPAPRA